MSEATDIAIQAVRELREVRKTCAALQYDLAQVEAEKAPIRRALDEAEAQAESLMFTVKMMLTLGEVSTETAATIRQFIGHLPADMEEEDEDE